MESEKNVVESMTVDQACNELAGLINNGGLNRELANSIARAASQFSEPAAMVAMAKDLIATMPAGIGNMDPAFADWTIGYELQKRSRAAIQERSQAEVPATDFTQPSPATTPETTAPAAAAGGPEPGSLAAIAERWRKANPLGGLKAIAPGETATLPTLAPFDSAPAQLAIPGVGLRPVNDQPLVLDMAATYHAPAKAAGPEGSAERLAQWGLDRAQRATGGAQPPANTPAGTYPAWGLGPKS